MIGGTAALREVRRDSALRLPNKKAEADTEKCGFGVIFGSIINAMGSMCWLVRALGLGLIWLGVILVGGWLPCQGQPSLPDSTRVDSLSVSFSTQRLDGPWQVLNEDTAYQVPFEVAEVAGVVRLRYHLSRPEGLEGLDSLYLWLEGVAWQAELLLDDYYLGVHQQPFRGWRVPLASEWLRPEGSVLVLRLQAGRADRYEPKPFVGMVRPVWLLHPDRLPPSSRATVAGHPTDTVGLLAPYYGPAHRYCFDSLAAIRRLLPLKREGITRISFWYEPGSQLRALCRSLGLEEVDTLHPGTTVMMANAFPFEVASFDRPPRFWLDEAGHRSSHYGHYLPWEPAWGGSIPREDRPGLALLLLLPLIGAFLVKLSSPGFFSAQTSMLTQPSLHIENTFYNHISSNGALLLLTGVRMLIITSALTLMAYGCARYQLWSEVSLLTERSLFFQVFGQASGLGELWLLSVLVVAMLEGIRHLLMGLIGQVFRIKGLLVSMVGLDVVGSYPLLWLLGIPLGLWLFTDGTEQWLAGGLTLVAALSYWLRRMYVNFLGLDRGASFSSGMKFLYVCTFNIAPMLIWL